MTYPLQLYQHHKTHPKYVRRFFACTITVFIILTYIAVHLQEPRTIIANSRPPKTWILLQTLTEKDPIGFKILLRQNNLDKLKDYLLVCSDPLSPLYGQYLKNTEINNIVRSDSQSTIKVIKLLAEYAIDREQIIEFADYLEINTTCQRASELFQAQFGLYKSTTTDELLIRGIGAMTLPTWMLNHIDFVVGISDEDSDEDDEDPSNPPIEPSTLRDFYKVPKNATASHPKNSQGLFAFNSYFSMAALQKFAYYTNTTLGPITTTGKNCLADGCDEHESDLDMQYMMSMGQGVPTVFMAHDSSYWVLEYAQEIMEMDHPPLVHSMSYGFVEEQQCQILGDCSIFGYDSQQYIKRAEIEFMKLGCLGVTLLASDGDDGAQSFYGTNGACPIQPWKYCPVGGCIFTFTRCPQLSVQNSTTGQTLCILPHLGEGLECSSLFSDPLFIDAINSFGTENKECGIYLDTDTDSNIHIHSSCVCQDLKKYTVNGYSIKPYVMTQDVPIFFAEYPASSPYVTSVGATQFRFNDNQMIEFVASLDSGSLITTGMYPIP
eukprot:gene15351-18210_t